MMKNRTTKCVFSLILSLILTMSLAATAFAADPSIEFKGFTGGFELEPGSEYTETDLFDNFKNVMPGDVLTEEISFTNSAADCDFINLYMRAVVHDEDGNPLSPNVAASGETAAAMSDFLAQLSMKVWNGTELIYDASPDELDGLKENKLLGVFRTGDRATLRVELTVPAALSNEFADRVGEVDWVFHVEAYQESQLSVRKVWSDGNANHTKDSITVNLLKDGQVERSEILNAENQWAFTFDRLPEGHEWTVEEAGVPKGYEVSYQRTGTSVVITNTKEKPDEPDLPDIPVKYEDLTVKKRWDNKNEAHPGYVTVTLYDGDEAVETVNLSAKNQWSYTWKDLPSTGNWQVTETNIPKGYTPSYSCRNGVVTITNTATLIHTGQLKWPVPVLGGLGVLLIAYGFLILTKKRKNERA